jgi:hypothetical protein
MNTPAKLVSPLHVATILGKRLRYFRTPYNDGRPDLPWHCVDDLQAILGLSREQRRYFLKAFRNGPFASSFETVATEDGIVTIAPHYVAQGFIGAAAQMVGKTSHLYNEYSDRGHKRGTQTHGWAAYVAASPLDERCHEPSRAGLMTAAFRSPSVPLRSPFHRLPSPFHRGAIAPSIAPSIGVRSASIAPTFYPPIPPLRWKAPNGGFAGTTPPGLRNGKRAARERNLPCRAS